MFFKDARPRETIRNIRGILRKAGFNLEIVSWKHPVPHVWSVHVRQRDCGRLSANGKGTSRELALASALGEFMERLNSGYFWSDYSFFGLYLRKDFVLFPEEKWFSFKGKRPPAGLLERSLLDLYNPNGELAALDLVSRVSAGLREGICALPFTRVSDGKQVFFPVGLLDNLYASNGMASGNTPEEARVQALSEILERYVKYKVIREGIALPLIPERYYSGQPEVTEAVSALERRGFTVALRDASLGGRYPVINIMLGKRGTGKYSMAFGAHPGFRTALSRTLTELLQGQDLGNFYGLQKPCSKLSEAAEPSNLVAHFIDSNGLVYKKCFSKKADFSFCYVNREGSRREELDYLFSVFRKARKDVYIADLAKDCFYTCRIVVPGMSEVYCVDELILANNNRGMGLGGMITRLPAADKKELACFLRELDSRYIGDNQFIGHTAGLAFDEGSPWNEVCFGEVRMLAQLALGRNTDARKQLLWCLDSGYLRAAARPLYECLAFIFDGKNRHLEIPPDLDPGILSKAGEFARGRQVFRDLFDRQGRPRGMNTHKRLSRLFMLARRMKGRTL